MISLKRGPIDHHDWWRLWEAWLLDYPQNRPGVLEYDRQTGCVTSAAQSEHAAEQLDAFVARWIEDHARLT